MTRYETHVIRGLDAECRGYYAEALRQFKIAERYGWDEHLPVLICRVEKRMAEAERSKK